MVEHLNKGNKMNFQIENMEGFLQWVKTCPYAYSISSMSGGFIHVKILIPVDKKIEASND
tara:strand:+ start:887 stop:1066 length:180 start_codon:yes stop_codon:yes gene_type:complete